MHNKWSAIISWHSGYRNPLCKLFHRISFKMTCDSWDHFLPVPSDGLLMVETRYKDLLDMLKRMSNYIFQLYFVIFWQNTSCGHLPEQWVAPLEPEYREYHHNILRNVSYLYALIMGNNILRKRAQVSTILFEDQKSPYIGKKQISFLR